MNHSTNMGDTEKKCKALCCGERAKNKDCDLQVFTIKKAVLAQGVTYDLTCSLPALYTGHGPVGGFTDSVVYVQACRLPEQSFVAGISW